MKNPLPFASVVLTLAAVATAQKLKVGDPAPALAVAKWVKGEPVEAFAADHVYVVEFWATWCGPCIAGIPHLTRLQAAHREQGLTIIGVTAQDPRNSLAAVEALVEGKGDGMGYTVAWDDGRKTNEAYMRAAGRDGIPCAFVVDKAGKLAYIGHPIWLDLPLAGVLAGTWDAAKGQEQIQASERRLRELLTTFAKDPAKAGADAEALVEQHPFLASIVHSTAFSAWLQAKDFDQAYAVANKLVDHAIAERDDATLNQIAWSIVDPEADVQKRDLDLALRAAEKGVELTKAKDANVLDTLARVHFWKKNLAKALELQKQAVALDGREELKKALAEYEQAIAAGGDKKVDEAGAKK